MDCAAAKDGKYGATRTSWAFSLCHVLMLGAVPYVVVLTSGLSRWRFVPLAIISVLAVAGDLRGVQAGGLHLSGSALGVMLAAVVLGPGPAVVVGVCAVVAGWWVWRESLRAFLSNLANFASYPLVAALSFHWASHAIGLTSSSPAFYLIVFGSFIVMLTFNFLLAAGWECLHSGASLLRRAQEALIPLLSAQLFSALLVIAAVYVAIHAGTGGIMLVGVVLAVFQYLIGELLKSKQRGEELHRLATTDTLTGLANRDRFHTEVGRLVASVQAEDSSFAVMLVDLDRFKEINDTLGHHYGDELLRKLGPRLAASAGDDGLVARLGGDEFALLMPVSKSEERAAAEALADQLITSIQEAIYVDELALEVGASIGIARYPDDGDDANTLLRCADVAMYAAKEAHTGWKFYATELDRHSVRQLSVLSDFRRALEQDEIVVYYQPIVDIASSTARGAEALVRWDHPTLGLQAPGAFMPTVEQTGLIGPLTSLVLERAVEQCAQWRALGRELSVAVNLSVRNLLDRELPHQVERLLTRYALPPEALQLEITESMLMSDPDRVLAIVTRLSALGVRLSVDDFGTGYSSLANLRNLPIDELKIDRSFVMPMLRDDSDLVIVRSTINLAHDLGMRVIAEGVEDEETLMRLSSLGCDQAQGYYFGRPMPSGQFVSWLDEDAAPELALAV